MTDNTAINGEFPTNGRLDAESYLGVAPDAGQQASAERSPLVGPMMDATPLLGLDLGGWINSIKGRFGDVIPGQRIFQPRQPLPDPRTVHVTIRRFVHPIVDADDDDHSTAPEVKTAGLDELILYVCRVAWQYHAQFLERALDEVGRGKPEAYIGSLGSYPDHLYAGLRALYVGWVEKNPSEPLASRIETNANLLAGAWQLFLSGGWQVLGEQFPTALQGVPLFVGYNLYWYEYLVEFFALVERLIGAPPSAGDRRIYLAYALILRMQTFDWDLLHEDIFASHGEAKTQSMASFFYEFYLGLTYAVVRNFYAKGELPSHIDANNLLTAHEALTESFATQSGGRGHHLLAQVWQIRWRGLERGNRTDDAFPWKAADLKILDKLLLQLQQELENSHIDPFYLEEAQKFRDFLYAYLLEQGQIKPERTGSVDSSADADATSALTPLVHESQSVLTEIPRTFASLKNIFQSQNDFLPLVRAIRQKRGLPHDLTLTGSRMMVVGRRRGADDDAHVNGLKAYVGAEVDAVILSGTEFGPVFSWHDDQLYVESAKGQGTFDLALAFFAGVIGRGVTDPLERNILGAAWQAKLQSKDESQKLTWSHLVRFIAQPYFDPITRLWNFVRRAKPMMKNRPRTVVLVARRQTDDDVNSVELVTKQEAEKYSTKHYLKIVWAWHRGQLYIQAVGGGGALDLGLKFLAAKHAENIIDPLEVALISDRWARQSQAESEDHKLLLGKLQSYLGRQGVDPIRRLWHVQRLANPLLENVPERDLVLLGAKEGADEGSRITSFHLLTEKEMRLQAFHRKKVGDKKGKEGRRMFRVHFAQSQGVFYIRTVEGSGSLDVAIKYVLGRNPSLGALDTLERATLATRWDFKQAEQDDLMAPTWDGLATALSVPDHDAILRMWRVQRAAHPALSERPQHLILLAQRSGKNGDDRLWKLGLYDMAETKPRHYKDCFKIIFCWDGTKYVPQLTVGAAAKELLQAIVEKRGAGYQSVRHVEYLRPAKISRRRSLVPADLVSSAANMVAGGELLIATGDKEALSTVDSQPSTDGEVGEDHGPLSIVDSQPSTDAAEIVTHLHTPMVAKAALARVVRGQ